MLLRVAILAFQTIGELTTNLFGLPIIGDLFIFDGIDFLMSGVLAFLGN